jgi:hypothetical protein
MPRHSYKLALRAKGIKPIPRFDKLRSHRGDGVVITASEPEKEKAA